MIISGLFALAGCVSLPAQTAANLAASRALPGALPERGAANAKTIVNSPASSRKSRVQRGGVKAADSGIPPAATPEFSLAPGAYSGTQSLSITDATPGAAIYYTTDGTYPTASPTLLYTGAITISQSEVIVAMAAATGTTLSARSGAYFISSSSNPMIYTLTGGADMWGYGGDGGLATLAQVNSPTGAVKDAAGNIYFVDSGNIRVRKIDAATGVISTIAGDGVGANTGDAGPAQNAELYFPSTIAIDAAGNLYISEIGDNAIRRIDASTGTITTYLTHTGYVTAMACDAAGNLYFAGSTTVSKAAAGTAAVTVVAGTFSFGFAGDGGPATAAELNQPSGLALDGQGNMYISDTYNNVIRKVDAVSGFISTVAGLTPNVPGGSCSATSGDGGPATSASLCYPYAIGIDGQSNLYIADAQNNVIREVNAQTGIIKTVGGVWGQAYTLAGGGYPATSVALVYPRFLWVDSAGDIYASDSSESQLREIPAPAAPPTAVTAAPQFSVASGTYDSPQTLSVSDTTPGAILYVSFVQPSDAMEALSTLITAGSSLHGTLNITGSASITVVAVAPGHQPSASVTANYVITSVPSAIMTTVAGTGYADFSAQGGPATETSIGSPQDVAFDKGGNMYISDINYCVIYRLDAGTGNISVIAGNGTMGYSGDGGSATSAQLDYPTGLAVDAAGNLYIADSYNYRVRVVNAQTGIITTFAGTGNSGGSSPFGDGGPATQAAILWPDGLAFDSAGDLFITDVGLSRIRMVNAQTGIISTVVGGGTGGLGDGGLATQATLHSPHGIAFDASDNLYIADEGNALIRMVSSQTGIVSSIAGNQDIGTSGDGGPAMEAEVSLGMGIAVDKQGNVYASSWPAEVRKISKADGTISLYAGTGYCSGGGDGGAATMASLCSPGGLAFDGSGSLYIAEAGSGKIRKVTAISGTAATPTFSLAAGTYAGSQSVTISDTTPNATIYYTTDGTTPTTASTAYSGAITVSQSETLQAIAVATGYLTSTVASAAYTITAPPPPPPGTYAMSATNATLTRGGSGTSTVTVSSTNGYAGTVTLHCAVTTSPSNAVDLPTCAVSQTVVLSASATSGTATVTVSSTAASASVRQDRLWGAGGGTALAALLFLIVPRRRRWAQVLMALVLFAAAGSGLVACGGGGSAGTKTNQPANPGTTTGAYTITVTGTGSDAAATAASTTFTLTVN